MATADEYAQAQQSQLSNALQDGLDVLDLRAAITFTRYSRVVLPIDRYIYWQPVEQVALNGSLHYSQETVQNEEETAGIARVVFTTRDKAQKLSDAPVNSLFVTTVGNTRAAFSRQEGFYTQAALWHYSGISVYPALASQLLDRPGMIDPSRAVASNSLPLWIAFASYVPFYAGAFVAGVPLFPAFAVEPNLVPPYGVVNITRTSADTSAPYFDNTGTGWRVCRDTVRVTLYGLQSDEAHQFLYAAMQYSVDSGAFGIINMPVVADDKRPQAEIMGIAMKKSIEFEVSYLQERAAQTARQLITKATMALEIAPNS